MNTQEQPKPTRMLLKKGLPVTIFYTPFILAEDTWVEGDIHLAIVNGLAQNIIEPPLEEAS